MTQLDEQTFRAAIEHLRTAVNWSRQPESHGSPGELLDRSRMALGICEAVGIELFQREAQNGEADHSGAGETEAASVRDPVEGEDGVGEEKVG